MKLKNLSYQRYKKEIDFERRSFEQVTRIDTNLVGRFNTLSAISPFLHARLRTQKGRMPLLSLTQTLVHEILFQTDECLPMNHDAF
jgi:hypothetical protein